jgi:hypothetical protein
MVTTRPCSVSRNGKCNGVVGADDGREARCQLAPCLPSVAPGVHRRVRFLLMKTVPTAPTTAEAMDRALPADMVRFQSAVPSATDVDHTMSARPAPSSIAATAMTMTSIILMTSRFVAALTATCTTVVRQEARGTRFPVRLPRSTRRQPTRSSTELLRSHQLHRRYRLLL